MFLHGTYLVIIFLKTCFQIKKFKKVHFTYAFQRKSHGLAKWFSKAFVGCTYKWKFKHLIGINPDAQTGYAAVYTNTHFQSCKKECIFE